MQTSIQLNIPLQNYINKTQSIIVSINRYEGYIVFKSPTVNNIKIRILIKVKYFSWYSIIHDSCDTRQVSYLTRSITLSLGAELTGSSLIMMISSPGISLPSDGPPATIYQTTLQAHTRVIQNALHFLSVLSCGQSCNERLLIGGC